MSSEVGRVRVCACGRVLSKGGVNEVDVCVLRGCPARLGRKSSWYQASSSMTPLARGALAGVRLQDIRLAQRRMDGLPRLKRLMLEAASSGVGGRPGNWGEGAEGFNLSKLDSSLLRKHVSSCNQRWFCERLGPKWGLCFARYRKLIGDGVGGDWLEEVADALVAKDEEELISVLKKVSRLAIEHTVYCGFGPHSVLMDLHVIGGYDTVLNRKDVMASIRQEVGVAPPPLAREDVTPRMLEKVRRIIRENWRGSASEVTFEHFVQFRDAWSTPGASTLEGCAWLEASDGFKVRVKGKFASALQYEDDWLVAECKKHQPAIVKPFLKGDEPVKTRVVYGYDFLSFLRCSWIDSLVGTMEHAGSWMPVGYGRRQKADMRLELLGKLKAGDKWAVSLDQSAFDQHQRKEWVRCVIEEIFQTVAGFVSPELRRSVLELMEAELFSFDNATIPGVCDWAVGVPSGLKWTAIIDSVLNRAANEIVCEDIGFKAEFASFQGDDAVLVGSGVSDAAVWAAGYSALGLEVNADKTWVSRTSCDYLHEIYRGDEVRAFPARIGKSIIWKKPAIGASGAGRKARLLERMSDCLKGCRRDLPGCRAVATGILREFALRAGEGGSGLAERVEECLDTPTFLGGFGFGTWGRLAAEIAGGDIDRGRYKVVSPVPGRVRGFEEALVDRLAAASFLRTSGTTLTWRRVRHVPTPSFSSVSGEHVGIRSQWTVRDGVGWEVQLHLELGRRGKRGYAGLLPDRRLRDLGWKQGVRALNAFERVVGSVNLNLEDAGSTGESYLFGADWAHHKWRGACAVWAIFARSAGVGYISRLYKEVVGCLLGYYLWVVPELLVRV